MFWKMIPDSMATRSRQIQLQKGGPSFIVQPISDYQIISELKATSDLLYSTNPISVHSKTALGINSSYEGSFIYYVNRIHRWEGKPRVF